MAEQLHSNGLYRNQFYNNYQNHLQYQFLISTTKQQELETILTSNVSNSYQSINPITSSMNLNQNYLRNYAVGKQNGPPSATNYPKQRFTPYHIRYSGKSNLPAYQYQQPPPIQQNASLTRQQYYNNGTLSNPNEQSINRCDYSLFQSSINRFNLNSGNNSTNNNNNIDASNNNNTTNGNNNTTTNLNSTGSSAGSDISSDDNQAVVLVIGNLDSYYDENTLRYSLLQQLKPITPVISLTPEGSNAFRVKVPSKPFAKLVVTHMHRKKIGHKRIVVSYARDSSSPELATLRCQVAGLLKDVPYYSIPMNTFRELFQSRFKTSINVVDLFRMQDICIINCNGDKEKVINLHPDLVDSIRNNNPLVECLQLSVPYCTLHFRKEQNKGWAEQDIEPLPNVVMSLNEMQLILHKILRIHRGDIPILSIMHCIEAEMNITIQSNDNGVNLEHLISCVTGCQITNNKFGIKVLTWSKNENGPFKESCDDPLYHISHEVVELIKLSPKSTLKFNKFIPAYHNHFGKQCRVADYGYIKLIDLFEELSSVVQVIGDGENRLLTLTHRTQLRRFTNDLLRILKTQTNRSILLSQLPIVFSQIQNRKFDVTDYGVCDLIDILDGLVHNNTVVTTVCNDNDILISIPKRQQTQTEYDKTAVFAEEVIELLKNAPKYSILLQKFVRSYHYHFGYQCRLNDYGFYKLTDLMDAITGIIELEPSSDENRKIFLSQIVARRVFSEQLFELACSRSNTDSNSVTKRPKIKLCDILSLHKDKYGYQIQKSYLGFSTMIAAVKSLPYVEMVETNNETWIICHHEDPLFRTNCYAACTVIVRFNKDYMLFSDFCRHYSGQTSENCIRNSILAMNYFIELKFCHKTKEEIIKLTPLIRFIIQVINYMNSKRIVSLMDLKRHFNIQLITCFEFGFPNLSSLVRSFPDIFLIEENNSSINNFEIELNSECFLSNWINSLPNKSFDFVNEEFCIRNSSILNSSEVFSSSGSSGNENINLLFDANNNIDEAYGKDLKLENENIAPSSSSSLLMQPFSENESLDSLPRNQMDDSSRLCIRRNVSFNSDLSFTSKHTSTFCDPLDYARLLSSFYEPPKPDTPPSKMIPFWMDPVWSNEKPWSPDIDGDKVANFLDGKITNNKK